MTNWTEPDYFHFGRDAREVALSVRESIQRDIDAALIAAHEMRHLQEECDE